MHPASDVGVVVCPVLLPDSVRRSVRILPQLVPQSLTPGGVVQQGSTEDTAAHGVVDLPLLSKRALHGGDGLRPFVQLLLVDAAVRLLRVVLLARGLRRHRRNGRGEPRHATLGSRQGEDVAHLVRPTAGP